MTRGLLLVVATCWLAKSALACPPNTTPGKTTTGARYCEGPSGLREGPAELVYPTGELAAKGSYEHGRKQGEWTQYYQDGTVWMKQTFADGEQVGSSTAFFPDQHRRYELHYQHGKASGTAARWDAHGRQVQQGSFDQDHASDSWTVFDPWSGLARATKLYFDGTRCWFAKYFDEGGNTDFVRRRVWHGGGVVGPSDCKATWDARAEAGR